MSDFNYIAKPTYARAWQITDFADAPAWVAPSLERHEDGTDYPAGHWIVMAETWPLSAVMSDEYFRTHYVPLPLAVPEN